MNAQPISERKPLSPLARVVIFVIGLIFCITGVVVVWWITIGPLTDVVRAGDWPATECEIVSSELRRHEGDESTTWSADISFTYQVESRQYRSDNWSFFNINGSRDAASASVNKYPTGSRTQCFFDPGDPKCEVLDRSFQWSSLFGVLFLLFTLAGGGAIYYAVRGSRHVSPVRHRGDPANPKTSTAEDSFAAVFSAEWEGPRRLKPESTPAARMVGIGIFGLLWNGFIGVFIYIMLFQKGGGPDVCFMLFMVPFVVVGLVLIGAFVHQLLALGNPVVEVALSNGSVKPGDVLDIAWEIRGKVTRIRELQIDIEGREQVRYTRGTNTYTDKEVFCTINVTDTREVNQMQFGNRQIEVPAETLHSLDAPNNKIIWTIRVKGEIPLWPDISEEFPFRVKPL